MVGGGIFGVTAAFHLADAGHEVTLYERNGDLLTCASGINQFRLHRGYHYPRSDPTAIASKESEEIFRTLFSDAVVTDRNHHYAVAREGSHTPADSFFAFCNRLGLNYEASRPDYAFHDALEACMRVEERLLDPDRLRGLCWGYLDSTGVDVQVDTAADRDALDPFDFVVVATYAALNELAPQKKVYQYEVSEVPVVRVPESLRGESFVIIDGPFLCIDPFGSTGYSILGNVVETNLTMNVGHEPQVPEHVRPLLNRGPIVDPPVTNFHNFVKSASRFIKETEQFEHVGSMFTIRTVLPYVDHTDERPTLVEQAERRMASLFSGKIGTCVTAAREVTQIVANL